jgi:hypothetical protein
MPVQVADMDDRRKAMEGELAVLEGRVSRFRAGELAEIEGGRRVDKSMVYVWQRRIVVLRRELEEA